MPVSSSPFRPHRRRSIRRTVIWPLMLAIISMAVTPMVGDAAQMDLGAVVDATRYSAYITLAEALWLFDQILLLWAHQLELWRAWMMTALLTPVFEATVAGIRFPFWLALTVAWVVFVVTQNVKPIFGREVINLQRVVGVLALALFVFHNVTQILPPLERTQRALGQEFGQMARRGVANAHLTVPLATKEGALRTPQSIYSEESCEGLSLARRQANGSVDQTSIYLNDLAATYVWADAKDIHCATHAGDRPWLPRAMIESSGGGGSWGSGAQDGDPGYFVLSAPEMQQQTAEQRSATLAWAWQGVIRLLCGFPLALIGLVEQSVYFLLALALFAAVVGVVFGLLIGLFLPDQLEQRLKQVATVFWTSLTASFWLGLISAILLLVADVSHSATMLLLMTFITGKFVWDQNKVVWGVLTTSLHTSVRAGASGTLAPIAVAKWGMERLGGWLKERRQERKDQQRWEKREQMREERRKTGEGDGASSSSGTARSTARGTDAASVPPPASAAPPPPPRDWAWYESRIYAGSAQSTDAPAAATTQPTSDAPDAATEQTRWARPMSERKTEPHPVVTPTTAPQQQDADVTDDAGSRGSGRRARVYTAPSREHQAEEPHHASTTGDHPTDERQASTPVQPAPSRPVQRPSVADEHERQADGPDRAPQPSPLSPPVQAQSGAAPNGSVALPSERPLVQPRRGPAKEDRPVRGAERPLPESTTAPRGASASPTATADKPGTALPQSPAPTVDGAAAATTKPAAPSSTVGAPVPPKRRPRPGLGASRIAARQTTEAKEGVVS